MTFVAKLKQFNLVSAKCGIALILNCPVINAFQTSFPRTSIFVLTHSGIYLNWTVDKFILLPKYEAFITFSDKNCCTLK